MKEVLSKVDLTALKSTTTESDILELCNKAKEMQTASVCVPSYFVGQAFRELKDTDIKVCTVVGFPNGNSTTSTKIFEALEAMRNNATEIDMVANIGQIVAENWNFVESDIKLLNDKIREYSLNNNKNVVLKVIVETCYLTDFQIEMMCKICADVGVDFIKTSTGFGSKGAELRTVRIMKECIDKNGYNLKIKASGGIRSIEGAKEFIEAGADRIGASSLK